jgi:hypothetical protein
LTALVSKLGAQGLGLVVGHKVHVAFEATAAHVIVLPG